MRVIKKPIINKVFKKIKEYDEIVIARHVGPDPDALASQMALKESILLTFPEKKVYAVGVGVAKFKSYGALDKPDYDKLVKPLLITLDVPNIKRVDGIEGLNYDDVLKIDHHPAEDIKGKVDWTEEVASSTCQMVAELILNSLRADEILNEAELPILYAGFSPCFRREAGAAGKDTRVLTRVHQFMKTEQLIICKNDIEESEKWHQKLLAISEEVLQDLELPYQVLEVCTGDMGAPKYRQYDLEAWVPTQNCYRETHSCSNITEWQARRTNLRYRDNTAGKVKYVHTLNNTGIATPRILVPFLENHQQADGSIYIPVKLQPYMMGKKYIGKNAK